MSRTEGERERERKKKDVLVDFFIRVGNIFFLNFIEKNTEKFVIIFKKKQKQN